jgi:hypothetical protein
VGVEVVEEEEGGEIPESGGEGCAGETRLEADGQPCREG